MGDNEIIAVFIDGENIHSSDFSYILREIRKYGRIVIFNIYGDWSDKNVKSWIQVARENGVMCIQCDKISGKNSVDLRLSVDIMKILYTNDIITLFYLVTSDSDYRHVIFEIKQKNKKIFCIGSSHVNIGLTAICDLYTKIENLKKDDKISQIQEYWNNIEEYLLNNDNKNLSKLKETIQKTFPDFDHRDYGYNKFSEFILNTYKDKLHVSYEGNAELLLNEIK
jgi:uncharacterized protein (TIGR00288 family)